MNGLDADLRVDQTHYIIIQVRNATSDEVGRIRQNFHTFAQENDIDAADLAIRGDRPLRIDNGVYHKVSSIFNDVKDYWQWRNHES